MAIDKTHLIDTLAFQLWVVCTIAGTAVVNVTNTADLVSVVPWIALIIGIAANEVLPGCMRIGVRVTRIVGVWRNVMGGDDAK